MMTRGWGLCSLTGEVLVRQAFLFSSAWRTAYSSTEATEASGIFLGSNWLMTGTQQPLLTLCTSWQ
jgi:hypothetical protein